MTVLTRVVADRLYRKTASIGMRHVSIVTSVAFAVLALVGQQAQAQTVPNITGLSQPSATVGSSVTITGTGFGSSEGLNTVSFAGILAAGRGRPASVWTNTSITVTVPSGATTGNVVVSVGGQPSNGVSFAVIPVLQSLSSTSGVTGTLVTISGSGFGNTQAQGSGTVAFNGFSSTPTSWTSSSIVAPVPSGASVGNVIVTVAGQSSNGLPFTPIPVISSVSPTAGPSGSTVTIAGSSFGNTQGQGPSTVAFNGVAASVPNWSNTSLTATVPLHTNTGNIVVTVNGVASNGVSFTLMPAITGISPNPVLANQPVTITGSNFGTTMGTVTFSGVAAAPTAWTDTSITAAVPPNAPAGNVVVTAGGVATNPMAFSFVPPHSFSLTYAPNGDVLTASDTANGSWTYAYDDINRLATANNTSPQQGFKYSFDPQGNRWGQTLTAGTGPAPNLTFSSSATASTNGNCFHAAGLNNQPDGLCYDAAGNLLSDFVHSYTYDAENRIIAVDGGQTAKYAYDADGRRIRAVNVGETVDYVTDLSGHVVAELSSSGTWNRSEAFAAERHLATYNPSSFYFVQSDWLGSERVRALPNGAPFEVCANLPFGDGQSCTGSADPSPNHFTGKQQDLATQLHYFTARDYTSSFGRFMSPDPAGISVANPANPQSWNLYSYVNNNPLGYVDPWGLECVWDDGSFDSENDPETGSVGQCQDAGGTWIELGQNGLSSSMPNAELAQFIQDLGNGLVNLATTVGVDGKPYVTFYDSQGRVTETIYGGWVTAYAYWGSDVVPQVPEGISYADPDNWAQKFRDYAVAHPGLPLDPDQRHIYDMIHEVSKRIGEPDYNISMQERFCAAGTLAGFGVTVAYGPFMTAKAAQYALYIAGITLGGLAIGGCL